MSTDMVPDGYWAWFEREERMAKASAGVAVELEGWKIEEVGELASSGLMGVTLRSDSSVVEVPMGRVEDVRQLGAHIYGKARILIVVDE